MFTDEGYSGASLVRPALERLRDLAAQVPVDVVICYSPDRLARKLAYQTRLSTSSTRREPRSASSRPARSRPPRTRCCCSSRG